MYDRKEGFPALLVTHNELFGDNPSATDCRTGGINIVALTHAVLTGLLASYGAEAVAAFGVNSRVESLAMLAVMALGLAYRRLCKTGAQISRVDSDPPRLRLTVWSLLRWLAGSVRAAGCGAVHRLEAVIDIAALYFLVVPFSYAFGI